MSVSQSDQRLHDTRRRFCQGKRGKWGSRCIMHQGLGVWDPGVGIACEALRLVLYNDQGLYD